MKPADSGEERRFFGRWPASRRAVAVLCACLAAAAIASWQAYDSLDQAAKRDFAFACEEIRERVEDRLRDHELILRSGAGVFAASEEVTRDEWRRFVVSLRLEQQYPGIQGVGFAQLVDRQELDRHQDAVRAEGFPEYKVRPGGDRLLFSTIIYLEPFSGRNLRAFGYDMFSEPVRREAMERARDSGVVALSGPVVLVQETAQDVQAGTLMYFPVYRHGLPAGNEAERRAAILGWVYSPYRMNDLLRGILGGWELVAEKRIRLRISDQAHVADAALLFDSQSAAQAPLGSRPPKWIRERGSTVEFGGRSWRLEFFQAGPAVAAFGFTRFWATLLGGILVSLLAFALALSIFETAVRARTLAEKLTGELAASESRFRLFASHARDLLFRYEVLPRQGFSYVSPASLELIGYRPEELCGDAAVGKRLLHPDDRPLVVAALKSDPPFAEMLTLRWLHRDGRVVWTEQQNTPIYGEEGRVVAVEGVARDITARRLAEEALRRSEEEVRKLNADLERRVELRTAELEKAVAELREREAEIRQLANDLEQRVVERTADLEAANRDLASFASSVSHDLKAPLRALDGFTGLVLESTTSSWSEEDRRALLLCRNSVARMRALIDDLLTLSRVNRSDLAVAATDLAEIARAIGQELRREGPADRRVELDIPELLRVEADPGLMRVVLENLLRNAWKFTSHRDEARVELGAQVVDGERAIFVRDNGAGFDPRFSGRLFRPFQRLHREDEFPGTGLGLATVASVIRRHGGRIWAESVPGAGATFYFTLGARLAA